MNKLLMKSAAEMADMLRNGEITSVELTQACLDRIAEIDGKVHAFLHVDAQGALATAAEVDKVRAAGEELHPLAGVPIAVKDNIVTRGVPTTAGSKILEGWKPPYDATVVEKIKAAKLPIVGKTNLDEFAMGSSTEHSAYGPSKNPWDTERIPGGSGGGSAAAVGSFMVPLALGTDTGGSIRQPAAVTGTVGAKPTYGAVSRYGAIAMASSLDQIGPVTRTVEDAILLQDLLSGNDVHDSTSLAEKVEVLSALEVAESSKPLAGMKVGLVKELGGEGYETGVVENFNKAVDKLRDLGAEIVEISCPTFEYALWAYYLIMPAEVSSNLARFDGMRYGIRVEPKEGPVTAETVMAATRAAGFGPEVKRRIILGTHVLSAGNFDAFYGAALRVRTLVQRDLDAAFSKVDVFVSPSTPGVAFKFGEKMNDPLAMYLNDVTTIPANLAGTPALSLPSGLSEGLPTGIQIVAPAQEDARMYRVGLALEKALGLELPQDCPAKEWEK
ncbi:Asp-tRNA(Asn)/Glu-tRNA(Gln) amidotransferase subunit GatA [Actinotignum urinale]|uniref:Glutamyl-tRNA(Gln) amidotransferase subunit A n=1 Tax=Actinotignum urinale TaxID=190146 RepID=A0ABU5G874_9ACTO|nr:Asp-tRNA(Asn)/Glu-tRNA(Gln) amidotransferase subunit GatA [Actinotignum urinale]MDY5133515.1 Asp-tRNA(Asn)/Glu-tRNA(Gln) amidotransferase subunit GatA [Actinotignum urinale]